MDGGNCSFMTAFIFLGITDNTEDKATILTMVLIVYLIGHLANLGMIFLIKMDPQLHTSMYFFPGHLSFCVLCYSTAIHPKMTMDLFAKNKSIPFYGCALQFFVFHIFADSECLLLAVMAMTSTRPSAAPCSMWSACPAGCAPCSSGDYLLNIAETLIYMILAFHLCFCGSNEINHFFCDLPPLFLLSRSDIQVNELALFTIFGFIELSTISGVLFSYYIILSILKIHSSEGKFKAFSTLTSLLNVVTIF